MHSVLRNLASDRRLRLYLIDGGLRAWTRRQLLRSWDPARVDVTFLRVDLAEIRRMPVSEYVSHSTYLRLILPAVLPADEQRAIYLDSDLVVQRDLGELWDLPLGGALVLAAQDVGFPCLDAEKGLPNYAACKPYLTGERPIPNYAELGLPPDAPYFNGGVMLVDLAGWRAEQLSERMLRFLEEHREHALHWDQYALNALLVGRWGRLDLRWNAPLALKKYPTGEASPFDPEEYRLAREEPWVIHYVGAYKPWYWGRRGLYGNGRQAFAPYYAEVGWPRWRRWRWTLLPVLRESLARRRRRLAKRRAWLAARLRRAGGSLRARAAAVARKLGAGTRRTS